MNSRLFVIVGIAMFGALTGCKSIYSSEPVGHEVADLTDEDLDGYWIVDDEVMLLKVTDAAKGEAVLAGIEDRAGTLTLQQMPVVFRKRGDVRLVSVKAMENEEHPEGAEWIWWGAVRLVDGGMVVWVPDPDRVEEAVEEGALPGRLEEDAVVLGELSPAQLDLLTTHGILHWEEPLFLRRVGD